MVLRIWIQLVLVIFILNGLNGQYIEETIIRCPENWVKHDRFCYRFINSPLRHRSDAERNCQILEANLVSINSLEEHRFITQQLLWRDPQHRRWYTSGRQKSNGYWVNEVDDSSLNDLSSILHNDDPDSFNIPNRDFLAYSFKNSTWGLERVTGDEPLTYICKTTFEKLIYFLAEERSFLFGSNIEDPEFMLRGPYMINQPQSVFYDLMNTRASKNVNMTCRAGGYPTPTYEWYQMKVQDGNNVSKKVDPLKDDRYTVGGGSLIINNPSELIDAGKYFCKATNKFGTIVSETVQLGFTTINEFNAHRQDEAGNEHWGKTLNCDPPTSHASVRYVWGRPSLTDLVQEDQRIFISEDGALYFSSLEKIDGAQYSCMVHDTTGEQALHGRNGPIFRLSVISSSQNQKLTIANTFPKVFPQAPLAGKEARLECFAFSYPTPTYEWSREGGVPLPVNHRIENFGRVLVLPYVRVEDQGEYICTAREPKEQLKDEVAKITISVQAEPNFTIPLVDRHVDISSEMTWQCEAYGNPDVSYRWYRNGELLSSENPPNRYMIQDNILKILSLTKGDDAMFQCEASNTIATKYSSAQLRVLDFKPSFKRHPLDPEIYAGDGSKVSIICSPEAAPKAKIEWKKNDFLIGAGGNKFIVDGNLTIIPVTREDAGRYTCLATNVYGADTTSTYLTVFRMPTFVETLPQKWFAIVGQNVDMNCRVVSEDELDTAYKWTHNGLRLHTVVHTSGASLIVGHGRLSIQNVSYQNAGQYECLAKSVVGTVRIGTTLIVEGPPSQPGGLVAEALPGRGVRLRWTNGAANGRPVISYKLSAKTDWDLDFVHMMEISNADRIQRADMSSGRMEFTISGDQIIPYAHYEFRLAAVNEIGTSKPSMSSPKINTASDRPRVPPANVSGGGGKIGDLSITWSPLLPYQENGPDVYYKIFWRRHNDEKEYQSKELRGVLNNGIAIVQVTVEYYYTQYDVKVQAINKEGAGPVSEPVIVYSAEDVPHVQPQSPLGKPYNSTAINVTWTSVDLSREMIRGRLIGYRLKYWKVDLHEETASTFYLSRSIRPWSLIVGLQPNTSYFVKVMAFNGAGAGPESERVLERTYLKAPQQPPTSVFAYGISPSSVKLVWRYVSPNQDEEPLTGFKVRVWPLGEDVTEALDTIVLVGEKLEATVTGLLPGKPYSTRVLAFSNGGDGRMSSPTVNFQLGRTESFINSAPPKSTFHYLFTTVGVMFIFIYAQTMRF